MDRPTPHFFLRDRLSVEIYPDGDQLAAAAAAVAAEVLHDAIRTRGKASVIFATANSQLKFLAALTALREPAVDWSKVVMFHMDEYLGLPADHPASFRRSMRIRVEEVLRPAAFHYLEGDAMEPLDAIRTYADLLRAHPPDLCCLGIGENGHLAFNDPAVADFADTDPVKIVRLDTACRLQQVGEGHFPDLAAVPAYAMTLTIPTLCQARRLLAIVPERRKAEAVRNALEGPVDPACPASYLRTQSHCTLYLDPESAGELHDDL